MTTTNERSVSEALRKIEVGDSIKDYQLALSTGLTLHSLPPPRILLQKSPPIIELLPCPTKRRARLIIMANRCRQCIRRIQVLPIQIYFEGVLQHGGYLFLGGVAIASDGLFDLLGGVFGDFEAFGDGGGHGHALSPAQFEHGLWIFAKKGRFDGQIARAVLGDDAGDPFKNALKFLGVVFKLFQVNHSNVDWEQHLPIDFQDGVAQDVGARIDA